MSLFLRRPTFHALQTLQLFMTSSPCVCLSIVIVHACGRTCGWSHAPRANPRSSSLSRSMPKSDTQTLARARARYGLSADSRYILYLGGLDHRKNVPLLVRAFAHVYQQTNDPKLQLLIAGNPDQKSGPLFPH